jgi:ribosomal protein S27E
MATWGLACKNCRTVFTHSQIPETLTDYYIPTRPEFPPNGLERECPSCNNKSIYRAIDLTFQRTSRTSGH